MAGVIYNLQSVRAPLTGIGRYTVELLKGVHSRGVDLTAVRHGRKYNSSTLSNLLSELEQPGASTSKTRRLIGNLPLTHDVYRAYNNQRFVQQTATELNKGMLYHDLNYTPCGIAKRSVTTVYDLSHVSQPSTHPLHRVRYLTGFFKRLEKRPDPIITISSAVKHELCESFNILPERVFVTPLAADKSFQPRSEQQSTKVLSKYRLSYKRFVLCVGAIEPRKNLLRVLSAYEKLTRELKSQYPLVIAGPEGWKNDAIKKKIKQLEGSSAVIRLGFVPQDELPILYAAAAAFVYPSLYEGFGLPLLEAMSSGCPTITSRQAALSELSGQATLSVNPTDIEEIHNGLERLLSDSELRLSLTQKGLHRASDFSWDKTTEATLKVYDSI